MLPGQKAEQSMSKEIYISSTPHETRLAIVEDDALAEIYYERENEYTLAGSIYNGKVTRVLPGMQSSFVDIGLERDAFLYITDFMEEAGDSADFEAGGERAPRSEGRGGDRGRRDGRGDGRARTPDRPVAAEPSDADLFNSAVSSLDPARPADSDRGRGGRSGRGGRGGRGGRDRNADSPRRDTSDSAAPAEPLDDVAASPIIGQPGDPDPVGEGAPGADGSRRWRGRRGRRGGRGPGRDQAAGTQTGAEAAPDAPEAETESSYVDYDRLDIDASAAPPIASIDPAPTSNSDFVRPERPERSGRNDRDRGRGGRDSRGRGGDRDRGPRGFAPRSYAAGPDDAPAYGTEPEAPAGEPIVLPGESLSKYRKGDDNSPASTSANPPAEVLTTTPSTEFKLADSWDGGAVLPGETLRRREPSAGQSSQRPERSDRDNRGDRDRGSRDRSSNDRSFNDRPREPRAEASHTAAPVQSTSRSTSRRKPPPPTGSTQPRRASSARPARRFSNPKNLPRRPSPTR